MSTSKTWKDIVKDVTAASKLGRFAKWRAERKIKKDIKNFYKENLDSFEVNAKGELVSSIYEIKTGDRRSQVSLIENYLGVKYILKPHINFLEVAAISLSKNPSREKYDNLKDRLNGIKGKKPGIEVGTSRNAKILQDVESRLADYRAINGASKKIFKPEQENKPKQNSVVGSKSLHHLIPKEQPAPPARSKTLSPEQSRAILRAMKSETPEVLTKYGIVQNTEKMSDKEISNKFHTLPRTKVEHKLVENSIKNSGYLNYTQISKFFSAPKATVVDLGTKYWSQKKTVNMPEVLHTQFEDVVEPEVLKVQQLDKKPTVKISSDTRCSDFRSKLRPVESNANKQDIEKPSWIKRAEEIHNNYLNK